MDSTHCFTCERCQYSSKVKSNLYRHLSRAKACKPINETTNISTNILLDQLRKKYEVIERYECRYGCGKTYRYRNSMYVHAQSCKKKNCDTVVDNEVMTCIKDLSDRFQREIKEIKDLVVDHSNVTVINNNNSTTSTNNTNVIINLRDFGNENLDYVMLNDDLLNRVVRARNMHALIREVNFHPDHPENHNVYASKDTFLVREDGEWTELDEEFFTMQAFSAYYKIIDFKLKKDGKHVFWFDRLYDDSKDPDDVKIMSESIKDAIMYFSTETDKCVHVSEPLLTDSIKCN